MQLEFDGEIWFWRGPAPWYFVTVPGPACEAIRAIANQVTYGWGMIPARVRVGKTSWETALWPKDDAYIVPLKASVRRAEKLDEGDWVDVQLEIGSTP